MAPTSTSVDSRKYTVVARRYRPQRFDELVGQNHVSKALTTAIAQHRVGHAYLFTGARGTGKTSTARIFAKCLNCQGFPAPTDTPCNQCDACESIAVGEDLDVIEIDGASNRGIEEIREIRSNVNIRPSRCRFKIYIIDEVHMLTSQAFNALLKTLEEPPEHVKFLFCTTDPHKIPITVLSRCLRFDFIPVESQDIVKRLREIATAEQVEADEDALQILARRAAGSMRDSQSLLEQLLGSCEQKITAADVNSFLGIAAIGQVGQIFSVMIQRDGKRALDEIQVAIAEGVDPGQLGQQLVAYSRDAMATRLGCSPDVLLSVGGEHYHEMVASIKDLSMDEVLAILQILDHAVVKMQHSLHARILLEAAVVRVCQLERLAPLSELISELSGHRPTSREGLPTAVSPVQPAIQKSSDKEENARDAKPTELMGGDSSAGASKKKVDEAYEVAETTEVAPVMPPTAQDTFIAISSDIPKTDLESVESIWKAALHELGGITADMASEYQSISLTGAGSIQVVLSNQYNFQRVTRAESKSQIEASLERITNKKYRIDFHCVESVEPTSAPRPVLTRRQQIRQLEQQPLIKALIDQFDAEIVDFSVGHDGTGQD